MECLSLPEESKSSWPRIYDALKLAAMSAMLVIMGSAVFTNVYNTASQHFYGEQCAPALTVLYGTITEHCRSDGTVVPV